MLQTGKEVAEIAGLFYSDIPVVLALPVGAVIIIIMFILYYFNPQGWKKLYAYIVLFMAVFTAWLLMSSNVLEMLWGWRDISYYGLRLMAYFLPITANLVIYELLKERSYAHMGWVLAAYSLLGTLAIGSQLMGYETLDGCMNYYYPLLGIGEPLAIYWCIKAAREGDILCKAVAPSAIAYTLLGLFDGFSDYFAMQGWRVFMTPLAVYAFLYFVIIILREQIRYEQKLQERIIGLEYEAIQAQAKLEIDPLTGSYSRKKLKSLLLQGMKNCRQQNKYFAMLLLDIDFFKKINDSYGHEAGDAVLRAFAMAVRQQLRKNQYCVRWGGEEFIVLSPNCGGDSIRQLAENIRQHVEATMLAGHKITCSIGIAFWQGEKDTADQLFKRVDRALYKAKNQGRNCVCVAE
ncbi:GGDEF domain-containing protein [Selenomonas sp. AE3005]|uniref:GGDEF domain-containing protein n=1 Tax=Selenomonas sp. AE3005 TaxID=1485543 RepID=UPI0025CEEB9A|nr:GGDEF domain-containing protein [Selenomonas sp. AE3005]